MLMTKPSKDSLEVLAHLVNANISDHLVGKVARELVQKSLKNAPSSPSELSENIPELSSFSEDQLPVLHSKRVIIDCKDASDNRTSVSFTPARWSELLQITPDEVELRAQVKKLAEKAPSRGRSQWIYRTILKS